MLTRSIAISILVSGCSILTPTKPIEPPYVEVTDDCGRSCANLRTIGCPEGQGSLAESCSVVCLRASQLRELPLACWTAAKDVVAARSCGSLRCIR